MKLKEIHMSLLTTMAPDGLRHKPAFTHGVGRLGESSIRLYLEDKNYFSAWAEVARVAIEPQTDINKLAQLVTSCIMAHENHTLVEIDHLAKWYRLPSEDD